MQDGTARSDMRWKRFEHPIAFWVGAAACATGVILHIPMYYSARTMGYRMAGMHPDAAMIVGMALIGAGLLAALYGLLPRRSRRIGERAAQIHVRALDDARIRPQHVALLLVISVAIVIDAMKPAALSFVAPGMAKEYGLKAATNPHGGLPVSLLPLSGISGTVIGSLMWGWLADRIGRRSSILLRRAAVRDHVDLRSHAGIHLEPAHVLPHGHRRGRPAAHHLRPAGRDGARPASWLAAGLGRRRCRGRGLRADQLAGGCADPALQLADTVAHRAADRHAVHRAELLDPRIASLPARRGPARRGGEDHASLRRGWCGGEDEPAQPDGYVRDGFRQLSSRPLAGSSAAIIILAIGVGLVAYGFQLWIPTNLQHLGYTAVNSDYIVRNASLIGLVPVLLAAVAYGFWSSKKTIFASFTAARARPLRVCHRGQFAGPSPWAADRPAGDPVVRGQPGGAPSPSCTPLRSTRRRSGPAGPGSPRGPPRPAACLSSRWSSWPPPRRPSR